MNGGEHAVWEPPWKTTYSIGGLGWDGEAFTVVLVNSAVDFATASLTPKGELVTDVTIFGRTATSYGEYDVETDPADGTTVFVSAVPAGVEVSGRRGRDKRLTAPKDCWSFGTQGGSGAFSPSVALNGNTALIAWASVSRVFVREVSLETGEERGAWVMTTDGENVFKDVAAVRAPDGWMVAGVDYSGVIVARIRGGSLSQSRLVDHGPGACSKNSLCGVTTDWRWQASELSLLANGDAFWIGVVDMSMQRVDGVGTLFTYRVLPVRDGCTYGTLVGH